MFHHLHIQLLQDHRGTSYGELLRKSPGDLIEAAFHLFVSLGLRSRKFLE